MTVNELLNNISSMELTKWIAYFKIKQENIDKEINKNK